MRYRTLVFTLALIIAPVLFFIPLGLVRPAGSMQLVFSSNIAGDSFDLYKINLNGSNFHWITTVLGALYERNVYAADCDSRDGSIVFVTGGGIHRINADGSGLTTLRWQGFFRGISLLPLRNRIAFTAIMGEERDSEIYVANSDATNVVQLTGDGFGELSLFWSPDGTRIAFDVVENNQYDIGFINADGSNQRRLPAPMTDEFQPTWSPDGQRLAFTSNRDGHAHIYTMFPDGNDIEQLTRGAWDDMSPRWSPDGGMISFSSNRGGGTYQIYVMDADGSHVTRVTNNNRDNFNRCWLVSEPD